MTALARLLTNTPVPPAALLTALLPALLINVFIVGLNQLSDIPLDAVNKPSLPLPSGALTPRDARRVVTAALLTGLAFCFAPAATPALRGVLLGSAAVGAAYSAPPVRLKRHALPASLCILCVRGLLVNVCFYRHAAGGGALPPLVSVAAAFFVAFGVVIALLKDVPDVRGDRLFGVRTFSVRAGAAAVFRAAHVLLAAAYAAAALATARLASSPALAAGCAAAHLAVGAVLVWRARSVDAEDQGAVYTHYMDVWKAFYLEYLLLPLAAL